MKNKAPDFEKMTKNQIKAFFSPWFGEMKYKGHNKKWFSRYGEMTAAKFAAAPEMKKETDKFKPLGDFGLR